MKYVETTTTTNNCGFAHTMEIEIYVQHEIEVLHETFNNKL